jgi:sigma-B regulation protein RsbU (phosphoserine phosphatase)
MPWPAAGDTLPCVLEEAGNGTDERLRRIEAVTDTGLSRLDTPSLFDELLDRLRDLMQVDTAAILLLDPHARQLVAVAAKGLEEEVRQEVRISVGRGFAGRVAHERRPVIIADVTPGDVVNPILLDKGIRSLLGVPMFAGDELVGVLHVGSLTSRAFTSDDVHLLRLVADRASLASKAQSSSIDRAAALALQRSLLPTRLPDIPGIDIAARYVPGHDTGVGGDWYDVFTLPSGWLGVVIGDVAGHGLPAAVVMGRLRSALRAYTLVCKDPADALTHLDRKIEHFEAGNLATALYALIPPDRSKIDISLAGHLPPVLASPRLPAHLPVLPTDPPLGIGYQAARRHTVIDFPPDAVLVCYTDGLVERRGENIDEGLARLRLAVLPDDAETVCATIMAKVGEDRPVDDIAVLTLRRTAD